MTKSITLVALLARLYPALMDDISEGKTVYEDWKLIKIFSKRLYIYRNMLFFLTESLSVTYNEEE